MSEFSVHRTADRIPALRYCLVLDGTRIAGGKPDYRGDNHLISWQTDETYGPVDDLMAENAKLRELLADTLMQPRDYCQKYGIEYDSWDSANAHLDARMRELGVEP